MDNTFTGLNTSRKILKTHVLFLSSWYPHEGDPLDGIFVKKYADAVSHFSDISVLYVGYEVNREKEEFTYRYENGVHVFRLNLPYDTLSNVIIRKIKNIFFYNYYLKSFWAYKRFYEIYSSPSIIQLNVIQTSNAIPGLIALLIHLLYGIPYTISEQSTIYRLPIKNPIRKIAVKLVLQFSDKVLPISKSLNIKLNAIHPINSIIIPNIVDTNIFIPSPIPKHNKTKTILHVSILRDSHKNVSGIIKCVSELRKHRKDFQLIIVGEGNEELSLKQLAEDLQLGENYIRFLGGIYDDKELVKIYQSSDIFILNSNYETFGCVVIEAISCGIPVIVTRCGGPEEFVTPETGIIIEKDNPGQLIHALNTMLDNLDQYNALDLHNYAEKKFGSLAIGKQLVDIYQDIIQNN